MLSGLTAVYFLSGRRPQYLLFCLLLFIPFFAGSKAGFFIDSFFSAAPLTPDQSGSSLLWGLLLSAAAAPFIAKITKTDFWTASDSISPALSIALFFTRLGCLFNGCCIGKPAPETFPFPVYYPYGSYAVSVLGDKPFFPYPLFESLIWLFAFFLLLILRGKKLFTGRLMAVLGLIYFPLRFLAEFTRYSSTGLPLTMGQILSAAALIPVVLVLTLKK